ncbi:hypothetical protein [Lelliottia amnigena]|uniref:hypothetical protein n=1 Tax=Lelliottia amnigena TaxID=61646 RepID=UPI001957BAD1|nr:hypothetical protein [Lelliottia amnigena]MBM7356722.1 hypothetical protein [Lelliottia amnigena]WSO18989.1 hypothetical protein VUJ45_18280 [Lelliottia amnigena]
MTSCVNILPTSFESGNGASFGISNSTEGTRSYVRGLTVGLDIISEYSGVEHFAESKAENKIIRERLDTTSSFISHVKVNNFSFELLYKDLFAKLLSDRQFASGSKVSLINQLDRLGLLVDGWLGPNSVAPNSEAINEAKYIIMEIIEKKSLTAPIIRAVADGEINFYWNTDGYLIDMAFFGEGAYSYYYKNKLNGEEEYDDVSIDKGFSQKMLALLSWR